MFFYRPLALICGLLLAASALFAQGSFPQSAPSAPRDAAYAFTNATVYVDYQTRLEGATLVIRKGKVEACGLKVVAPKDAVVVNCAGRTIYPAFIDLCAPDYGLVAPKSDDPGQQQRPQAFSDKPGAFAWNEALRPEFDAADYFNPDAKPAAEWRKLGFGAALAYRPDGISRGTGAFVLLGDNRAHDMLLRPRAANLLSFRKGSSSQDYPSSLMGCIALLRQTYLDARWYQSEGYKTEANLSLEAWNAAQGLPQIFEAEDKLDVLRIHRLGQEFGVKYVVKTAGDEYQRLDEVKATGQSLIVPLNFPQGYDVSDPYEALDVPLYSLKHWEMAPSNPARLASAGIPFALTSVGMKDRSKFLDNLRRAVEYGLSEEAALKALTFEPAQILGLYSIDPAGKQAAIGSLEAGKTANFIICTGDIFQKDGKILETWVGGTGYPVAPDPFNGVDLTGRYQLDAGKNTYTLLVKGKAAAPEAAVLRADSSSAKASLIYENGLITLSFQPDTLSKNVLALSGTVAGRAWSGRGTSPEGAWIDWRAVRTGDSPAEGPGKQAPVSSPETGPMMFPFTAFGWTERPKAQTFLVKNATVWTNEKDGILPNTDVLVSDGKIRQIGKNLSAPAGATVIDGTGKHLTAGIIDEHSHIAASRSINEGTQESSAEVRIGDVIDSEDIDIYRQLAGGVTSSHILHGSANPIGGQTQLIKLRWGFAPEELKFRNWTGQIKFALGENVKQSNWGDNFRSRYPQSRMGVEQVYIDYFTRAQAYARLKKSGAPYRTDLEMEALQEILEGRRFITCHSYVQSEITMLMRVAERFNFRVNTFTHILEGYKVADKMARHGVGGSTFSDWWAYKMEVRDAIPQNAAIMSAQGITVSINSDDAEMARRLNQEAAKSVEYGGMKEEDAWKMVTLNPAKLLHVDDRVGSIRVGKDADLVLWNDNPLSVYARAEQTWVDGILFFDRAEDARRQIQVQQERNRIIQKMLNEKKGGPGGDRPGPQKKYYHCEDVEDEG